MNIKAIFRTSENRGDHAADVDILYEILPNETVEAFVTRVGMVWPTESIELKLIADKAVIIR